MDAFIQAVLYQTQDITLGALLVRSATAALGTLGLEISFSGLGATGVHSAAAGSLAVLSGGLNSIAFLLLGLAAALTGSFLSPEADSGASVCSLHYTHGRHHDASRTQH